MEKRPNLHNNLQTLNKKYIEHSVCNIFCDRDFLLTEDVQTEQNKNIEVKCPEIQIKLGNITTSCLIDTGSTISCLSEDFFYKNQQHISPYEKLPVSNTYVKTAVGSKSKRISYMVMMKAHIQQHEFNFQCLVVPNLIRPVILRVDTMVTLKMNIDVANRNLQMEINSHIINLAFNYITNGGITCQIMKYEQNHSRSTEHYVETNHTEDIAIEDYIKETINNNERMTPEQKAYLKSLLMKYSYIFVDTPGICTEYTHEIHVTSTEPFKSLNYPVPLANQEAVDKEIERMEKMRII